MLKLRNGTDDSFEIWWKDPFLSPVLASKRKEAEDNAEPPFLEAYEPTTRIMSSLLAKANGSTINYLKMVFSLWP